VRGEKTEELIQVAMLCLFVAAIILYFWLS